MTTLGEMLKGPCSRSLWERLCPLLEALDETELAAAATILRSWPPERRPMPDHWWTELLVEGRRPYHALAGTRRLGRLVDVEAARVPAEPDADRDEYEEANDGGADDETRVDPDALEESVAFPYGASAVAVPSDLRRPVFGAVAEWHHNGGDIVGWSTVASAPPTMYLSGSDYHDNPLDIQLSPDGGIAAASVECRWHAWSSDGEPLWSLDPAEVWPEAEADDDEGDEGEDDLVGIDVPVRFSFDEDGRRVAVGKLRGGPVAVLDARTGDVLAPGPDVGRWEGEGPVALDAAGRLLAHASGSRLVVRDVDSGAVLAEADTGLATIHALAMAPDGSGLLALGADGKDDPAVCSLSLSLSRSGAARGPATLTADEPVRADRAPDGMVATDPMSVITARAVWTANGPLAFMSSDVGDVLFGDDGRVLRLSAGPSVAAFTPDGRALITVGCVDQDEMDPVDVWFLDAMDPAAPARARTGQAGRTLP